MTDRMDFFRRSEIMFVLYTERKYEEALRATEALAVEFPQETPTTSFWRVCLLSRMRKTDEALNAMRAALDEGMWWSEEQLRADEDLAPLQGLPAFEAMVAECRTRQSAARENAKPDILIRLPAGDGPYPLWIALHGRASSPERDFRYWESLIHMGWLLAMPQSSQLGSPNTYVWDDRTRAQDEISNHYKTLNKQYAIDGKRVIVSGFSQGAALAIRICLSDSIPAHGFLAVSPGRIAVEDLDEAARTTHGKRGYLVIGGRDPRYELLTQIHALLNQNGIPCEMEEHPEMGHQFPVKFDQSINEALSFLFA